MLVSAACASAALAQDALDPTDEYRLKAAFLFNFATFTQWPKDNSASLLVCIYGHAPFGPHLDAIAGRKVGGRSLQVLRVNSVDSLDGCQLVFVTRAVIGNLARVLSDVA